MSLIIDMNTVLMDWLLSWLAFPVAKFVVRAIAAAPADDETSDEFVQNYVIFDPFLSRGQTITLSAMQ